MENGENFEEFMSHLVQYLGNTYQEEAEEQNFEVQQLASSNQGLSFPNGPSQNIENNIQGIPQMHSISSPMNVASQTAVMMTSLPGPSNTSQPESSNTSQPGPSNTSQPESSNTSQPGPSNTSQNNKIAKPGSKPKNEKRKPRTAYTSLQLYELENEFTRNKYLQKIRRVELSRSLSIGEIQIKTWFQNRRMKDKKLNNDKMSPTTTRFATPSPAQAHTRYYTAQTIKQEIPSIQMHSLSDQFQQGVSSRVYEQINTIQQPQQCQSQFIQPHQYQQHRQHPYAQPQQQCRYQQQMPQTYQVAQNSYRSSSSDQNSCRVNAQSVNQQSTKMSTFIGDPFGYDLDILISQANFREIQNVKPLQKMIVLNQPEAPAQYVIFVEGNNNNGMVANETKEVSRGHEQE